MEEVKIWVSLISDPFFELIAQANVDYDKALPNYLADTNITKRFL